MQRPCYEIGPDGKSKVANRSLQSLSVLLKVAMMQKIEHENAQPDFEYLVAWISQGMYGADINIYGNAAGLRSLASMLMRVADYDQSQGRYPDGDTLHCHLSTGLNTTAKDALPRVTLGRVEPKNGVRAIGEGFPELAPSSRSGALSDIDI